MSLREAILRHISVGSSGCWQWQGATLTKGYGQLTFRGHHLTAHRASYSAFRGPIPTGALICHTCDNPGCVNPKHLYAGTYASNRRDALIRDRWRHPYRARLQCGQGHPYVPGSYSIAKDQSRVCRVCMREHHRRYRKERRAP